MQASTIFFVTLIVLEILASLLLGCMFIGRCPRRGVFLRILATSCLLIFAGFLLLGTLADYRGVVSQLMFAGLAMISLQPPCKDWFVDPYTTIYSTEPLAV